MSGRGSSECVKLGADLGLLGSPLLSPPAKLVITVIHQLRSQIYGRCIHESTTLAFFLFGLMLALRRLPHSSTKGLQPFSANASNYDVLLAHLTGPLCVLLPP